jgi:formamidopyrimidine-DNA glycosylase
MPELPDVEGYRLVLTAQLPGRQVHRVRVLDAAVLRNVSADMFRDRVTGARFGAIGRHGKWLMLSTDGPLLLLHSGMTGRPYFVEVNCTLHEQAQRNDRLIIVTDHGELRYADLRKLGGVWILDSNTEIPDVTGAQGPDALAISATDFRAALHARRGALKPTLMNQQVIAGLGNMLSDEVCWRARLHPARPVNSLGDDDLRNLHRILRQMLRAAVKSRQIPRTSAWLSSVRDRKPAPCPRCGTQLQHSHIGGRTSIWCPHCQPVPATDDRRSRRHRA